MRRTRQPYFDPAQVGITGSQTQFTYPTLTYDENVGAQQPPKLGRAERDFARYLKKIARHVGEIISSFEPGNIELLPTMTQLLEAYANALSGWATKTVERMLGEVDARDRVSWRSLGSAISSQLKHDIANTHVGVAMRNLLHEQVTLIKSIPIEAGERVHRLTLKGLETSTRAKEIADQIEKSSEVTRSRAILIARTEVARTASVLTEARAVGAGLSHYIWRTAHDADVRPGHKAMEGKVFEWAKPPAVNENGRIMYHHPGRIWNCRCYAEPVVPREKI